MNAHTRKELHAMMAGASRISAVLETLKLNERNPDVVSFIESAETAMDDAITHMRDALEVPARRKKAAP
jgi:hypothetical protein